jgi:hypothetical protein
MDLYPGRDMYESFCNYQRALLAEFDRLSAEYHFETVDAAPDAKIVFSLLKTRILDVLAGDSRRAFFPKLAVETKERLTAKAEASPIRSNAEGTSETELVFRPFAGAAAPQNGNGHRASH